MGRALLVGLLVLASGCAKLVLPTSRVETPAATTAPLDLEPQRARLRAFAVDGKKDLEELRSAPYDPLNYLIPAQTEAFDKRRADFQVYLEAFSPEENQGLQKEISDLVFELRTQGLEFHGRALVNQLRGLESEVRMMQGISETKRGADDPLGKLLEEDSEKYAAHLADSLYEHLQKSIAWGQKIQSYVKDHKLEHLLYVSPVIKSVQQSAYDLGGPRDVAERTLVHKSNQEPSLRVLHDVKVRFENLERDAFELGALRFLPQEEREPFRQLVAALQKRMRAVKDSLRITETMDSINTLRDVFVQ